MTKRRFAVVPLVVMFALVTGAVCSSGDDDSTSSPGATTSAASSIAPSGSAAPNTGGYALAGDNIIAAKLLEATCAATSPLLVGKIKAAQDNGTVPTANGEEVSQVTVETNDGLLLDVTLYTEPDAASAATYYDARSMTGNFPTAIQGVGEKATTAIGILTVLKGGQVLTIDGDANAEVQAQIEQLKEQTGDPGTLYEDTLKKVIGYTDLACGMTGVVVGEPSVSVPEGALPPCPIQVSDIESELGLSGVVAQPVISDRDGYQQCIYNLGVDDGRMDVYTTTEEQMQASINAHSVLDEFTQNEEALTNPAQGLGYESFGDGRFQGFGSTSINRGIDSWVFINGDAAAAYEPLGAIQQVSLSQTGKPKLIARMQQSSSGKLLRKEYCRGWAKLFLDGVIGEVPQGGSIFGDITNASDYNKALDKLTEQCEKTHGG